VLSEKEENTTHDNNSFGQYRGHRLHIYIYLFIYKGKGKAIPLQALTGPEGSRRLRLPDFMTIGT
jgi:hypothetical protein